MRHPLTTKVFIILSPKLALISLLMCASLMTASISAHALPVDIELHRYMLATQKHLEKKDYAAAKTYLTKMKALQSAKTSLMPSEYFYYYAFILQNDKQYTDALEHYEKYIAKTGKNGEFYQQTLQAMTDIEESQYREKENKQKVTEQKVKRSDAIGQLSQANLSQNNDYDTKIKNLYLSESIANALILHINSLLATYPYSGQRIQTTTHSNAIIYTVKINDSNDIVTQKLDNASKHPILSTTKFSIYGANPFISHLCDAHSARCEIRTPDGRSLWVELAYELEAAEEITYAFSRLIKALQSSN